MSSASADATASADAAAHSLTQGLQAALRLPAGQTVQGVKRLSGGASQETWAFAIADARGGAPLRQVLRRAPAGAEQRESKGPTLAGEAQIVALAAEQGVPVPAVRQVLQPEDGLGQGFVSAWVQGETLGGRIAAEVRPALAYACGRALAGIHAVPVDRLPPLRRTQPADEVLLTRRTHARHGTVKPIWQMAMRWLADHAPAAVTPTLVHGDFRNGNLMVDLQAPTQRRADGGIDGHGPLVAVLDWELAHLGDPMADLGWLCVNAWRYGQVERPVGGFGELRDLFDGYRDGGGQVDAERVHWWQVLGSLRWGVMCEGMAEAWRSGAEPVMEKAAIGRRASEADIDLLDLLSPRSALAR